ncbi:MAG: bile acid:sodium symporter family protein [Polyangiaceae bacterium]|jgi:BASS family bile acid:Na+ symporter|nr:bile acid:sodium symporter family protein [Polyangiaceae bacterium]MBK8939951.1 bile acid:sodium symporter family protein [Polyangiaceae bacterium]
MKESLATTIFLPAALAIVMLGLGLSLTIADFKRVVVYPKAVIVGLVCQMVLLPSVCFGIAKAFALPPELAVGLMLLAASPGGATANLFSHLAKGDVALNITLTAVNSILALFSMPFIVNFALEQFMGEGKAIPLVFDKVLQVFAIVLIPVVIGMVVRATKPAAATQLEKPVKILSAVVLVVVIVGAVVKERAHIVEYFKLVGLAALCFNLASMAVGYLTPLLVKLPRKQAIAIGMEIGIHNGTLAIAIATAPTLLNNSTMSIPPAIYSLIMFFTAAAFGTIVARRDVVEHTEPAKP